MGARKFGTLVLPTPYCIEQLVPVVKPVLRLKKLRLKEVK
jgi:hypothetical protein